MKLPDDVRTCALPGGWSSDDDWLAWNLGRERARDAVGGETLAAPQFRSCPGDLGVRGY